MRADEEERAGDLVSDEETNLAIGTFTLPEVDNSPRVFRLALAFCGFFAMLFAIAYFIEDTNGDAYLINELVEFIMATTVVSWVTWIVGLGLNSIPNIPESLLLFSLTMIKFKPFYQRARTIRHSIEEDESEQLQAIIEVDNDAEFDEDMDQPFQRRNRLGSAEAAQRYRRNLDLNEYIEEHQQRAQTPQRIDDHYHEHNYAPAHQEDHRVLVPLEFDDEHEHQQLVPTHQSSLGHHHEHNHTHDHGNPLGDQPLVVTHPHADHNHQHTWGEIFRELFLMGMTPGALGLAAAYLVLSDAPLWVRIVISLGCGAVGGAADWIKHSYFNHAAEDEDEEHPYRRTFVTNIWATDLGFGWKLWETWVKGVIMVHHAGAGFFNWYSVLSVTALSTLMPSWVSPMIALVLAFPSFWYEGISETYAYDQARQRQAFQIHRVSSVLLAAGGIIHSLSFVIIVARIFQSTPTPDGSYAYIVINLATFGVLSVLLLYPGARGFYVMQKFPPLDHHGREGLCFDDVVRLILRAPRPERRAVNYELSAQVRFLAPPSPNRDRVTIVEEDHAHADHPAEDHAAHVDLRGLSGRDFD